MRRVHRHADERGPLVPTGLRRYRCRNLSCAWEGLVDRLAAEATNRVGVPSKWPLQVDVVASKHEAAPLPPTATTTIARELTIELTHTVAPRSASSKAKPSARAAFLPRRVRKAAVSLGLLSAGAMAATAMHFWPVDVDPHWPRTARGQLIALGESYDGDDLVETHALNQTVVVAQSPPMSQTPPTPPTPPTQPTSDTEPIVKPASALPKKASPPLALRQHCTWGQPGRSPYKGTVEEALRTAQVPEYVVQKVAERVRVKNSNGRLVINNKSIRLVGSKRQFSSANVTMTYGRTLCVETKVHFKKGHSELADLYDVTDEQGKRYAVMVPDVCGNVSVLAAAEDAGEDATLTVASHSAADVPEPGTLAAVVLGLLALVWTRRREPQKRAPR